MSTGQAGSVVVQVTAEDFGHLCENSAAWADLSLQLGRFEVVETAARYREWKRAYWLGDGYAAVIFARAFLAARGFEYEVLFDTAAGNQGGPMFGYVIVTDYEEEQ